VTRNASGAITQVSTVQVNFGGIEVAGLDYQLSYERGTAVGKWTTSISATQMYRYEAQLRPGSQPVDRLARADNTGAWAPKWKGAAVMGWTRGPLSLNVTGRYVGAYQDYGSTREIGNFWLYDTNARIDLGSTSASAHSLLRGAYIEAGGVNVFDRLPQYSNYLNSQLGYDLAQGDLRGRYVYLTLGLKL
jgi:iron complex outermembrane recepter protein